MLDQTQLSSISDLVTEGNLFYNELISRHNSYGIGGPTEVLFQPGNQKEIVDVLQFALREAIPVTIMGSGSNCLVSDAGIPGIVVSLAGSLNKLRIEGDRVTAEAGVKLSHMVNSCLKAGLTGFEGLVGIPGTVGGALVMNAGAFGSEIATCLVRVNTLTLDGQKRTYQRGELEFDYRKSSFTADEAILDAEFQLEAALPEDIARRQRQYQSERTESQPLNQRSAGSVFKNPSPETAAGMLIDKAGLKGTRRGDAEISLRHGNFFINSGNATAEDIAFLITLVSRTIKQQFEIQLELELTTLGFQPGYWKDAGLNE